MSEAAQHLAEVKGRIADAARAAGREPAAVTLVAVSKTHGADKVRELLAVGQRVFGENRVQEAEEKFPALKAQYPDLELHLIGPLQTNKAREAVALFDVIESVDERLATATRDGFTSDGIVHQFRHTGCDGGGIGDRNAFDCARKVRDRRGVAGDDGAPHCHALENLVRNDTRRLVARAEHPEAHR